MTEEEQRICIAVACGWTFPPPCPEINKEAGPNQCELVGIPPNTRPYVTHVLPSYLRDLNAMSEAEEILFPVMVYEIYEADQWREYHDRLQVLCVGHPGGAIRATAAQRAEAFLRTIGKWKEE